MGEEHGGGGGGCLGRWGSMDGRIWAFGVMPGISNDNC